VYFTAWPKGDGDVQLFDDIYGYDAKQQVARRHSTGVLLSRR
jgi:murein L,D-transpeptidase YcbB/YkuD